MPIQTVTYEPLPIKFGEEFGIIINPRFTAHQSGPEVNLTGDAIARPAGMG